MTEGPQGPSKDVILTPSSDQTCIEEDLEQRDSQGVTLAGMWQGWPRVGRIDTYYAAAEREARPRVGGRPHWTEGGVQGDSGVLAQATGRRQLPNVSVRCRRL